MSRLVSYRDLVRQRSKWTKALKVAKSFALPELLDYAQSTAIDYSRWIDEYRREGVEAPLKEANLALMQLQAVQDTLEERWVASQSS